jgi:quercetin dioxygenase-like cupin family protein
MKISKAYNGEVVVTKNGVKAQRIYNEIEAQVIHLTFEPEARLDTHTTAVDVFFYILEGDAWVEVGEEREAADKDCIIESPKGIPHALENKSDKDILRVMVVKTPRP